MKEIISIVEAYPSINFQETKAALATVVRVEGSSYRRAGARMLVLDNGSFIGGISGGCLEGDALRKAQKAIMLDHPSVCTYDTTSEDDHQIGIGLGCNGVIEVLFTPLKENEKNNPVLILSALTRTRVPRALITVIRSDKQEETGKVVLFTNEKELFQSIPSLEQFPYLPLHIQQALQKGHSKTIDYDLYSLFIEIIKPAIHLHIFGSNYDVYPLLEIAKNLGWKTTVYTRLLKAGKKLFESANEVKDINDPVLQTDDYTAVLLMSHDYRTDFNNLQRFLDSAFTYIGILGPRIRTERMYDELDMMGHPLSENRKLKIYSPAGLDIGAESPEEIALSIIAEIQSHFAGKKGTPLRLKGGPIHQHH